MNMNPASQVLHYSATDEDQTSWVAFTEHGNGQQWFVLDLSAKMSFDAVQIANCKYADDCTKDFKWVQNKKKYQINSLTFRISVSNEPEMEVDWEVVLEDSFEKECADVSNEIINVQLDSLVNEKRYIKFEILSFGGNGGCIQYFDVDRKPRVEKTSIML